MIKKEHNPLTENSRSSRKNQKRFRKVLGFFLLLFLIGFSFYLGYDQGKSQSTPLKFLEESSRGTPTGDETVDFSLFWKAWDVLQEKYINENSLDPETLLYGSIKGMMKASGDPYTSFLDPEETQDLSEQIDGEFEGIGAEIGYRDGFPVVIAPLDGSPAQQAGLEAGDKIIKIDDTLTSELTLNEAINLIRGKKGTQVTLTIIQEETNETKEIIITRDVIIIESSKLLLIFFQDPLVIED